MKKSLLIIANNNIGSGQSGGDTIFLEFIKNWQKDIKICVFGSEETKNLLKRYQIKVRFIQSDKKNPHTELSSLNILRHTVRRFFKGIFIFLKNKNKIKKYSYCYTVSDFYPDFFMGLLFKLFNPKGIWLCGQYLFAPKPGSKFSPYENQNLKGSLYFYSQKLTQYLANKYSDQILITSEPDRQRFPQKKVVVVQGGVDISAAKLYLKSKNVKPFKQRNFDAVFQGRLHPQKGVLELIDIWKLLTKKLPNSKLAIIGDGQLESSLIKKISKNKLEKNIKLFGFQSGESKYNIFKDSKIVVHPAIYDSGGMAAAEAMAWGLPGVSFDLESLKTYYPQGMLKSKNGNYKDFSNNIYSLLTKPSLYKKTSLEALELINKVWDWSKRANKVKKEIF